MRTFLSQLRDIAIVVALVAVCVTRLEAGSATKKFTHSGTVGTIIVWIDDKTAIAAPSGLVDWRNSDTLATPANESDAIGVFRLLTNVDVRLTATSVGKLTLSSPMQQLATYYKITSDGAGVSYTGFKSNQSGDGVGTFLYVGGGCAEWETANGTAQTFLTSSGKTITHVDRDGQVLLTASARGLNGEDLGSASDSTEAPDVGTYQAALTLIATAI